MKKNVRRSIYICIAMVSLLITAYAKEIDNSALAQEEFRQHKTTYGLVYRLPEAVVCALNAKIGDALETSLISLYLRDETRTFNLPHVTVVHIHSTDPETPTKMLEALPKLPPVLSDVVLKKFYTTEAAKDAGRPWWFDLGIVKDGAAYEEIMAFNTRAVAALTPLRDGPLPRVTGLVYRKMSDAGKELVQTVGVSGVNVIKDGKELQAYNPHTTLVYSSNFFSPDVQAALGAVANEFNKLIPEGITTTFETVSIVELGFAGNVLREFYRINLVDGSVVDVATGRVIQ